MRDAQAPLKTKPYSARTQEMATEIDKRTGNTPDLPRMIEDMYEDESRLALVAAPFAPSWASPVYPQLPLQGASETVQTVMQAAAQKHTFSYYTNLQTLVGMGSSSGPPADPGSSWGLLTMGLAVRQELNFAAMDILTRRFRERMAGMLVTNPIEVDRLAEIQPEPPTAVAAAAEGVIDTVLEELPDWEM